MGNGTSPEGLRMKNIAEGQGWELKTKTETPTEETLTFTRKKAKTEAKENLFIRNHASITKTQANRDI